MNDDLLLWFCYNITRSRIFKWSELVHRHAPAGTGTICTPGRTEATSTPRGIETTCTSRENWINWNRLHSRYSSDCSLLKPKHLLVEFERNHPKLLNNTKFKFRSFIMWDVCCLQLHIFAHLFISFFSPLERYFGIKWVKRSSLMQKGASQ